MRSVKKLLKKAMVFTLAVAMLSGTALTASAAPLNGVFTITDHWGNKLDDDDDTSHTGTVSNTASNTNTGVLKENETKILGITLDKTHLDVEVDGKVETLTATILTDTDEGELRDKYGEDTDRLMKQLTSLIHWEVKNSDGTKDATTNKRLSIEVTNAGSGSQITLNPRMGTEKGKDMIVEATIDGQYYINGDGEVTPLVTNKTEGYKAEATVSIKEYTTSLVWDNDKTSTEKSMYVKHTLDLSEVIRRNPETANDTITWTSTNTKVATVSSTGVVTAKKVNWTGSAYTQTKNVDDTCQIIAVGERKGAMATCDIKVEQGTASTKVAIFSRSENGGFDPLKSLSQDLQTDRTDKEILIQTYAKTEVALDESGYELWSWSEEDLSTNAAVKTKKNVEVPSGAYYVAKQEDGSYVVKQMVVTDTVTLTSNKATIADATLTKWDSGAGTAAVSFHKVGKANITVKTTSGKSAKLPVEVKATLSSLSIEGIMDGQKLYSGTSMTLTVGRNPEENTDAVKWSIAKVGNKANPNAKINSKGVLTIPNKLDPSVTEVVVELTATKAKDSSGNPIVAPTKTIKVVQSSVDAIYISEQNAEPFASVYFDEKNKKKTTTATQNIAVPLNKTYVAKVDVGYIAPNENGETASPSAEEMAGTLQWSASGKDKIVKIDGSGSQAKITAVGAGTATVTVSGVRAVEGKGNKAGTVGSASVIKATFKVTVKQPVESITLNKPSVVLAYQADNKGVTKDQKVALKATLGPKGYNKKETITWTVRKNNGEPETLTDKKGTPITAANASVTLTGPEIGDVYTITAKAKSGVSATSTVTIVTKTQAVQIAKEDTLNADGVPEAYTQNKETIKIGESLEMHTFVNISTDKKIPAWKLAGTSDLAGTEKFVAEDVTYSVSKKGIVSIDQYGNVFGLAKGKVTITATTPMNKKAKLTVTVQ